MLVYLQQYASAVAKHYHKTECSSQFIITFDTIMLTSLIYETRHGLNLGRCIVSTANGMASWTEVPIIFLV